MTESAEHTGVTPELAIINRELASILRMERAALAVGADPAQADELVICGILGGKNVGKSTLINALAKAKVSVDAAEVGKGTQHPMVYMHEAVRDTAAQRLHAFDAHVPLDVTTHTADPIRNVALVDLPDFDSEFLDHLQQVRAVAPLLDRILWVVTPRKIGDRAWVSMLQDVVKDPGNVHCVLNKVDELLSDGEPFERKTDRGANDTPPTEQAARFWGEQHEWVAHVIEGAGCPQTDAHRFLMAAAFPEPDAFVRRIGQLWDDAEWTTYTTDLSVVSEIARLASGELDRLRGCVLSPVSREERLSIKASNRDRERQVNITRIRRHYDLDRTVERIGHACDPTYQQQVLNEAMGPEYCSAVAEALEARLRRDTELADELLERRVEQWPLLRLVYWPLGWLSRIAGKRIGAAPARDGQWHRADSQTAFHRLSGAVDPFDVGGTSFVERIELMRSRVLADHAVIARQLAIEPELPKASSLAKRVSAAARTLVPRLETRVIDEIRHNDRRPSLLGKAALWLILLWFPFVQPILAGGLEIFAESGTIRLAHGLYRVVSALSAAHLLAGFGVVLGVYVALLAGMYARSLRAVRHARSQQHASSPITEAVDDTLVSEVVLPMAKPFQKRLERLSVVQTRLEIGD